MICNGQGRIYVPAMVYMIFIQRVFFVFYSPLFQQILDPPIVYCK